MSHQPTGGRSGNTGSFARFPSAHRERLEKPEPPAEEPIPVYSTAIRLTNHLRSPRHVDCLPSWSAHGVRAAIAVIAAIVSSGTRTLERNVRGERHAAVASAAKSRDRAFFFAREPDAVVLSAAAVV